MATYASPFYVLLGIPLMAVCCWWLSRWFPLIDSVAQTHAVSLPLDGLRGILAPAVLFHHAYITYVFLKTGMWKLPESNFYFQLGPSAVTMFFFISAYLFWSKMLKNPENLRPSRLWPNRMRRILPAYWTAVALFFLLVAVMSGFHLRAPAAKLALSVTSWIFAGFPGLNSPDLNGSEQVRVIGGIFWTLRVEWLFYFLLPALAWFRKGWRLIILFLATFALIRLFDRLPFPAVGPLLPAALLLRTFSHAFLCSFSIGMVAACHPWGEKVARWLNSPLAAVAGVVLLAVLMLKVPASYSPVESLMLAPVFFMIVSGNSFFGVLTCRPMRCLGQISYSVYIFHGFLLFGLTRLLDRLHPIRTISPIAYWTFIWLIALLVVAVSTFTYWFIERPFMTRRTPAAEAVAA